MTNLASRLPKSHGLGMLTAELIDNPHSKHLVVAVVNCSKVTTDMDTGEAEPTARILRIEAVRAADYKAAELLLRRALEQRYGTTELPFETQQDIEDLFSGLQRGGES